MNALPSSTTNNCTFPSQSDILKHLRTSLISILNKALLESIADSKSELCWDSSEHFDCFSPESLNAQLGRGWEVAYGTNTLVLITAEPHSFDTFRALARPWFGKGIYGSVIVLVNILDAGTHQLVIEKWQSSELSKISGPFGLEDAGQQTVVQGDGLEGEQIDEQVCEHPCCVQRLVLTTDGLSGGPLVIPFHQLMGRPPVGSERDLVIGLDELAHIRAKL